MRQARAKFHITLSSNKFLRASVIVLTVKMGPRGDLTANTKLTINGQKNVDIGTYVRADVPNVCTIKSTIRAPSLIFRRPTVIPLTKPTGHRKQVTTSGVLSRRDLCRNDRKASVYGVFSLDVNDIKTGRGRLGTRNAQCRGICIRTTSRTNCCPKTAVVDLGLLFDPSANEVLKTRTSKGGNISGHVSILSITRHTRLAIGSLRRLRLACTPPFGDTESIIGRTNVMTAGMVGKSAIVYRIDSILRQRPNDCYLLSVHSPTRLGRFNRCPNTLSVPLSSLQRGLSGLPRSGRVVVKYRDNLQKRMTCHVLRTRNFQACGLDNNFVA